jgi:hypothetical protein
MTHKIEPGMLCLVIGDEMAGTQVTTIRRIVAGDSLPEVGKIYGHGQLDGWFCETPDYWVCFADKHLLPINGIADDSKDATVKERDEVSVCG